LSAFKLLQVTDKKFSTGVEYQNLVDEKVGEESAGYAIRQFPITN
jgi:hypothetical protein